MQVTICATAVTLGRVVLVDDVHLIIVDIELLITIYVLKVVGRGGQT